MINISFFFINFTFYRYVVRETSSKIKIFKNFAEHTSFRPNYTADGLYGGRLIGVKAHNFLCFYDWDSGRLIRRIEITPKAVHWSKSGELVVIACDTSFFMLKYNHEATLSSPESEDGFEDAFEVLHEVNEKFCFFNSILIIIISIITIIIYYSS